MCYSYFSQSDGKIISLASERGIDILGDLIEASDLTVNSSFYGNLHNNGHIVISVCQDPDFRFKVRFNT